MANLLDFFCNESCQADDGVEYRIDPKHPMYRIGDDGSVWSKKSGQWRKLVEILKDNHYYAVSLDKIQYHVHVLVLTVFRGECPSSDYEGAHDNGKKWDNRLINLFWKTTKQNAQDRIKHGTQVYGTGVGISKATYEIAERIRKEYKSGKTQVAMEAEFGLDQTTISDIILYKTWTKETVDGHK